MKKNYIHERNQRAFEKIYRSVDMAKDHLETEIEFQKKEGNIALVEDYSELLKSINEAYDTFPGIDAAHDLA